LKELYDNNHDVVAGHLGYGQVLNPDLSAGKIIPQKKRGTVDF
jgi:hypothetical protein